MALTVTAWALTTFGGSVVEAYKEADVIGMPAVYRFDPGNANGLFPKIANRTVSNRADGSLLAASSVTETAISVAFDLPESVHELISYGQVRTYNMQAPQQYAVSFGRQLAEKLQNNIILYCCKSALGISTGMTSGTYRSDGLGEIAYNDEGTDGTDIASAVLSAIAQQSADKVPQMGRWGAIHPTEFNKLRKVNYVASRDYVSNEDNKRAFDFLVFGNVRLYGLASKFGVDASGDTSYAAKYRADLSNFSDQNQVWGIIGQDEALAIREAERPNGTIDDTPSYDSWTIKARCIRGMEALQPTAFVALVGDA